MREQFTCVILLSFCLIGSWAMLTTAGCDIKPREMSPNVLLIVIDTLRADHLGCYGYEKDTSPNIDRFSKTGTLFVNAYCQMHTTGPSHASIFTSTYPRRHGVLKNGWLLAPSFPTLAEILKKNGYVTGAVVSSFALNSRFGYSRGFDHYDEAFSTEDSTMGNNIIWENHQVTGAFDQRADVTTRKVIDWLEKHGRKKFFLWAHYFDPHAPYSPPEPYDTLFTLKMDTSLSREIAHYDGEIRFADREVNKVLDQLQYQGIDSKTLVIIMSDHGEGLGQHGWMQHGMHLYDEETRIPLMLRLPGVIPENLRQEATVESIDLAPTILDLLGIDPEQGFSGLSLVPMIKDPEKAAGHKVFLERRLYETERLLGVDLKGNKFGLRDGALKYIWAPEEKTSELYNLEQDPGELENLIDQHSDLSRAMQDTIGRWKKEQDTGHETPKQLVDPDAREKLRSLGYID